MKKRCILVMIFSIFVAVAGVNAQKADEVAKGRRGAFVELDQKPTNNGERGKSGHHHGRRWDRGARIYRGLDLTEDQKQELGVIKKLFREEVKELYITHRENMMSVLTSTQQDTVRARLEKVKAFRENRGTWGREKFRRHRGDFPGPVENGVERAAKSTIDKPVVTEADKTTWGKVKNLFE